MSANSETTDMSDSLPPVSQQAALYFLFAVIMIGLNILLQHLHAVWIVPFISEHLGHISLVERWYLSTDPYNMPELIGSALAVGITYVLKFVLDKFVVFQNEHTDMKGTGRQFFIYLGLAILTTIENIGIQFLLGVFTPWSIYVRIIIALTCGYITKFFLDRKCCFDCID